MVIPIKGILYDQIAYLHMQVPLGYYGRRAPCSHFELNQVECLEAYGVSKGYEECAKYIEDLRECQYGHLKTARKILLQAENWKQVAQRKIPWNERHGQPQAYDAFVEGVFYP